MTNDVYAPRTVAPLGARGPQDCLAEFGQLLDAAWWLPTSSNTGMVVRGSADGINSFADCVATCTATARCQYITYDYSGGICYTRIAANPIFAG
jgi:hypothetical protein